MIDAWVYGVTLLVFAVLGTGLWMWLEYVKAHGTGPVAMWVAKRGSHVCSARDGLRIRGSRRWCLYCGRCSSQTEMNGVPMRCWRRTGHDGDHRYGEVEWDG